MFHFSCLLCLHKNTLNVALGDDVAPWVVQHKDEVVELLLDHACLPVLSMPRAKHLARVSSQNQTKIRATYNTYKELQKFFSRLSRRKLSYEEAVEAHFPTESMRVPSLAFMCVLAGRVDVLTGLYTQLTPGETVLAFTCNKFTEDMARGVLEMSSEAHWSAKDINGMYWSACAVGNEAAVAWMEDEEEHPIPDWRDLEYRTFRRWEGVPFFIERLC